MEIHDRLSPLENMHLLEYSRQALSTGRLVDALTGYQLCLEAQPELTEALQHCCELSLQLGQFGKAVAYAEHLLAQNNEELSRHRLVAQCLNALLQQENASANLHRIVDEYPHAFTSMLFLAHMLEQRGSAEEALLLSLRAIKTAQSYGFWFDADSTPPWLRPLVTQAMAFADRGRRELFQTWLADYQERFGRDEMTRLQDCMAMYLGIKPRVISDPRQQPGFLYFPGLPVRPVFARHELPFADWYEAQTEAIHAEMIGVLHSNDGVQPFHYELNATQRAQMTAGAAWDAYFFFKDGVRSDQHHERCPQTSAILSKLPLDHISAHGPETCFSIMRPGAHILPHRGVTNIRSVLHLGLQIPSDCALNLCGIETLHWQAGRCFAFDDTYEHEAWNRSAQTRVVLLTDIWNPFLRPAEKLALADLIAKIGVFNKRTEVAAKKTANTIQDA